MHDTELLSAALNLLLYGMGVVFVFLSVLTAITTLLSWLTQRFSGGDGAAESPSNGNASADADTQAAALAAATHHHRSRQQRDT